MGLSLQRQAAIGYILWITIALLFASSHPTWAGKGNASNRCVQTLSREYNPPHAAARPSDGAHRQRCRLTTDPRFETLPHSARTFEDFSLNIALFQMINTHHSPLLDRLFLFIRLAGSGWALIPIFALVYLRRRARVKVLAIAVAIETVAVHALKQLLAQPRPAALLADVHLRYKLYGNSFPSGDAAMAFVVAFALLPGEPLWLRVTLICYGLLIMFERMYLGVHFPLDVLVGAIIGIGSALAARAIARPRPASAARPATG